MSLNEKDYAKYLKKAYFIKTGRVLDLKHPKFIDEKIQWLKIYDNLPIKTNLTDKILVRDYVAEKIGTDYLKPVFQVLDKFDDINFDILPEQFVVKCNHGCKWHFIIKDKKKYLLYNQFYTSTKEKMQNWLNASFFGYSDFETQYKYIKPKIFIEKLMRENIDESPCEIEVWCFNSEPCIIQKKSNKNLQWVVSTFDNNFNNINLKFLPTNVLKQDTADEYIQLAAKLSKVLAKDFKLVRIDWIIYKNKLYFNEMTFTPYSGFISFSENYKYWYLKLGNMLNLKGD